MTQLSRRDVIKIGGLGAAGAAVGLDLLALVPVRAEAAAATPSDIQHDIGPFTGAGKTHHGTLFKFPPVFTLFATARLTRTPTRADQATLAAALDHLESVYPWSPAGLFTFVSYGRRYFRRLPARTVDGHMPRLLSNGRRRAFEEAVPGPTDVAPQNPNVTKLNYPVEVRIEDNDILFTLRSDRAQHVREAQAWLFGGSTLRGLPAPASGLGGLLELTSSRLMFVQNGMPRRVAELERLRHAINMNPQSPMWMGFADQQADGAGPAPITTFAGTESVRHTTARRGDYFDNASVQHLSHVILDLDQFYARPQEPYTERCQYMFRSNPMPSTGSPVDQFVDGGGPTFLPNVFQGVDDAEQNARGFGTYQGASRIGHLCALQRSSRAADGTPVHIRMDGPGYDSMDVPGGGSAPKLQFTIFVPTADLFTSMRRNQASLDLAAQYGVADDENGLERFLTATRRQNFLVPPRRHRAFPLLETAHK